MTHATLTNLIIIKPRAWVILNQSHKIIHFLVHRMDEVLNINVRTKMCSLDRQLNLEEFCLIYLECIDI